MRKNLFLLFTLVTLLLSSLSFASNDKNNLPKEEIEKSSSPGRKLHALPNGKIIEIYDFDNEIDKNYGETPKKEKVGTLVNQHKNLFSPQQKEIIPLIMQDHESQNSLFIIKKHNDEEYAHIVPFFNNHITVYPMPENQIGETLIKQCLPDCIKRDLFRTESDLNATQNFKECQYGTLPKLVWAHICSYLEIENLISLGKTNKYFYQKILKSNVQIWEGEGCMNAGYSLVQTPNENIDLSCWNFADIQEFSQFSLGGNNSFAKKFPHKLGTEFKSFLNLQENEILRWEAFPKKVFNPYGFCQITNLYGEDCTILGVCPAVPLGLYLRFLTASRIRKDPPTYETTYSEKKDPPCTNAIVARVEFKVCYRSTVFFGLETPHYLLSHLMIIAPKRQIFLFSPGAFFQKHEALPRQLIIEKGETGEIIVNNSSHFDDNR